MGDIFILSPMSIATGSFSSTWRLCWRTTNAAMVPTSRRPARATGLSRTGAICQRRRNCAIARSRYLVPDQAPGQRLQGGAEASMSSTHFRTLSPLQHRMRQLYADTRRRLGLSPHVVRAQGARFVVDTSDYIDRCIALFGMWEAQQLEQLAALSNQRRVDYFLDVGANTGFYSIMFAIKNLAEQIVAFEPDPGNYARLIANLNANTLAGRIEAVPLALGDDASEVTLYEGWKGNRGESTIAVPEQTPQQVKFRVRQVRFDDAYGIAGKTLIIKMDVEGYEFQALAGMQRTLQQNECYLQVEHYGEEFERLNAQVRGYGYRFLHTHDIDHYFTNMRDIG